MMKRTFAALALTGAAWAALGTGAIAGGADPGSLLVYPCYDNRGGAISVISVVNTNGDTSGDTHGNIAVEFVYINGDTCLEFNRTVLLTPKDSFTAVTKYHNPNADQGYVYAFAKHPISGQAVAWDYLVGSMQVYTGLNQLGFETMPYVFKAGSRVRNGGPLDDLTPTDMDHDGIRDLNGIEYEKAPDIIVVPSFIGNGNLLSMNVTGELVVLGLTGIRFTNLISFAIYNDNEEMFSAQLTFDCWDRFRLTDITNAFRDSFLQGSNNNPAETQGLNEETGWYEMNGIVAFTTAAQIQDPAFLAMQIQEIGIFRSQSAERAFMIGRQSNGDLLPVSIFGDVPAN
jgi:hypothetical protein